MDRRVQAGCNDYDPFSPAKPDPRVASGPADAPRSPSEGQLWLMPGDPQGPRFRDADTVNRVAAEINAALGRSDTYVSHHRYTVLQFTGGRWETLVY